MGLGGIHRLQEPLSVTAAFFISAHRPGLLFHSDRVGADPFVPRVVVVHIMNLQLAVSQVNHLCAVPLVLPLHLHPLAEARPEVPLRRRQLPVFGEAARPGGDCFLLFDETHVALGVVGQFREFNVAVRVEIERCPAAEPLEERVAERPVAGRRIVR